MEAEKLNIYFCGSMRGVAANKITYSAIVAELKKYGHVLTEHVVNPTIEYALNDADIYKKDWEAFGRADCMIAEVSAPSHGVGIELGWAILKPNLPILCLSNQIKQYSTSPLITGCPLLTNKEYSSEEEAILIVQEFFKSNFVLDENTKTFKKKGVVASTKNEDPEEDCGMDLFG